MAIEREILKDITKYKTKFIGPLTLRQAVCVFIIALIDIPAFLILSKFFVMSFVMPCLVFLAIPPGLCGFYSPYDMPFEKFVLSIIQTQIISPTIRRYKGKSDVEQYIEAQNGIPSANFKKKKNASKGKAKEEIEEEFQELLIAGQKKSSKN